MRFSSPMLAAGLVMSLTLPVAARTLYVAPTGAAPRSNADGSLSRPWGSPNAALYAAKAGDTVLLMDGDHAAIDVRNRNFSSAVTIRAVNPHKARVDRIKLRDNTGNMIFRDLNVWSTDLAADRSMRVNAGAARNVTFDGLDVRSTADAGGYARWTKDQWAAHSLKGFESRGANVTLTNSSFTGVGFGLVLMGQNTRAEGNTIRGFSMDGMRVLGNDSVIRGNRITDAVLINANHPDAIQSWSRGGQPVRNMLIENNTVLEWSAKEANPYRAHLQGIGFFDGAYDGIVIRNNAIATTAYHGISLYGAHDTQITGNTVVNGDGKTSKFPWIGIFDQKNGKPSTGVTVSGNRAMTYMGTGRSGVVSRSNSVLDDPGKVLAALLAGSPAPVPVPAPAPVPAQSGKTVSQAPASAFAQAQGVSLNSTAMLKSAAIAPEQSLLADPTFVPVDTSPVPLPAAGWMGLAGMASLIALRRRRA